MYTIEEFDKEKTKILKYILYKKRTEKEVLDKFEKTIEDDLLKDIIDYLSRFQDLYDFFDKEYIEKSVNNFIILKNLSIREIEYKLISKGLKRNDIEDYIYGNKQKLEEYEIKSALNIIYKKSSSMEQEEIKQYLIKKGYKLENILKALEEQEEE